jgi:4-amino-4-deoxy-L-arabinose transferase-like glycosyltransferase
MPAFALTEACTKVAQKAASPSASAWLSRLGLPAVLAFAFLLTFYSGTRGIFPLDQSIVFDGGYRVYCGQVPYVDFYIPYGPIVFWIQAALFHLFGVNYYAHVLGAAILNVVGTASSFAIVRMLCRSEPRLALLAALLTAAWLYAPFGTTYPEQTAFCAILVGLSLLIAGLTSKKPSHAILPAGLVFAAGLFSVVGVLSKQNAGLPALGVFVLAIVAMRAPHWKRSLADLVYFVAGAALAAFAFTAWLLKYSDAAAFTYHAITIPRQIGAERLGSVVSGHFFVVLLTGDKGGDALRILMFTLAALFAVLASVHLLRRKEWNESDRFIFVAALLGIALIGLQNFFGLVSNNNGENEKPFIGILFAFALATIRSLADNFSPSTDAAGARAAPPPFAYWHSLVILAFAAGLSMWLRNGVMGFGTFLALTVANGIGCFRSPSPGSLLAKVDWRANRRWIMIGMLGVFAVLEWYAVTTSVYRLVHESFAQADRSPQVYAITNHSRFEHAFSSPGLRGLRWGEPTNVGNRQVPAADLEALLGYLNESPEPFFTFPDFTFLYAAVGSPSPQPMLWFHKGLTYPSEYLKSLDQKIVDSLRKHGVQKVVFEVAGFFDSSSRLADFPLLKQFIADEFFVDREIGIFTVYHARPDSPIYMSSKSPVTR